MERGHWLLIFSLLFLQILVIETPAKGQLFTQHKFHRLDEKNDLNNNIVNDIIQDTLGYIWIATEGGMARYMDNKFHFFLNDRDDLNSLPHNIVYSLFVDGQNQVWAMTAEGVGRYNYSKDEFVRYKRDTLNGSFTSMAIDNNGNSYFGKYSGGIWYGNDKMKMLALYDHRTGIDYSKFGVADLLIDKNYLWVAFRFHGFLRYDINNKTFKYLSVDDFLDKSNVKVFDIHKDKQNNIWITSDNGLWLVKENHEFNVSNITSDLIPLDDYLTINDDSENTLWLGTRQNGMFSFKYDEFRNELVEIRHFEPKDDDSGISHRTISKIYQDISGMVWIGTHNGGINVFNPEGEKVRLITRKLNDKNSLSYENVWGITPSKNGHIWVGTDGYGINIFDPVSGKVSRPPWRQLDNKAILCLLEDDRSRLWVGTYENGIYSIDLISNRVSNFSSSTGSSDLSVNDIRSFHQMDDGRILIGTNTGGLYYYDEEHNQVRFVNGSEGLDVRSIQSKGHTVYLGTFNSGLVKCDFNNFPVSFAQLTPRLVVTSSVLDGDTLWLGTRENGLIAFDVSTQTFNSFSENKSFRNVSISGIAIDVENNIWLTANSGIHVFEKSRKTLKLFDFQDGIQLGHFNYGSIFYSNEGFIVAGGINGMNLFYPDQLLHPNPDLIVIFDELKVLNEKMTSANSKIFRSGRSIFLSDKLYLHHNANVFSLSFSIPGFNINRQYGFKYMLEGYDEDWQPGNESNLVTYKNVPHGSYVFKVKSRYNSAITKDLNIIIATPFWRTWQAYLLFVLIIILALWRFIKFYNIRVALKQQLVFEQELREKDHQNMQEKLRFYTNFSHELKTPLTLIQGPVNDLIKETTDFKQQQNLKLIKKNTDVLVKFIERMLEFRKIEMNKTILNVGLHNLKILAQEEAESFSFLAKEKQIKFGFYCESELNAWVDIEKVQIIMNNLLSNAFKFSSAEKSINFSVFHEDDQLVIEVKDEGVGIPKDELEDIFSPFYQAKNSNSSGGTGIGLALCKSFVEFHGGSISVQSKLNSGSRFVVYLPAGKSHLEGKPFVRFIQVVNEEVEEKALDDHLGNIPSKDISDSDRVILVVDDNKDISLYVSSLFDSNFEVIRSDNARDALDKAIHNIPDIIISDIMMPGMDGLEFCEIIKENIATSHIPVILLTAKNSNQSRISGFKVGADEYISKPFNSDLLIARVNNLLDNRKLLEIRYGVSDLIDLSSSQNSREAEFVLKVESIVLQKLEQSEFNISVLCKELGMSQTSLYRKIRSITGLSIQLFIRKIKIKQAAHLLLSEDSTVTEIAFSLDFSDLKYFRNCFKEQYNMTPSEYRMSNQASEKAANL